MPLNLINQKFGRLTVVGYDGLDSRKNHTWKCSCECGGRTTQTTSQLRDKSRRAHSCGCAVRESIAKASAAAWEVTTKFRHPMKAKLKWLYGNMMRRCYDPENKRFEDYGGRGITVCEEWRKDRYSFYQWCLDNGIDWHLQIDRKDNDGPYSPDNCKFSTQLEQANNTRKNVFLDWNGKRQTISQWAREIGVTPGAIQNRIYKGWSAEKIFTHPFRGH